MDPSLPAFREPTAVERVFNRVFGFLVGLGLGFSYIYLLEVRGRKSGKLYLHANRSPRTQRKKVPGRPARTNTMGPQRRSRRRNHAEEGKHTTEISSPHNFRRREVADSENLSRCVRTRSPALLFDPGRFLSRIVRRDRRQLSSFRAGKCLIPVASRRGIKSSQKNWFSLLRKTKSYGIFNHPLRKGRPNLSDSTHKSLSGLYRPITGRVSFRASSDCAN